MGTGIAVCILFDNSIAEESNPNTILLRESFNDAKLKDRNWYDMTRISIVSDAKAGKGCIEYDWPNKNSRRTTSSSMRHLFSPTDFPKMKFNQFLMAPYFSPGLLPHAQKPWIDELVVNTKLINPLSEKKVSAENKTLN